MKKINNNPVLKGFNPDPTMCFAKGKYYIATSTFQWYPGITIYVSEDLINWTIVSLPLTECLGFDLTGIDDSAGIWAPNIIYNNGLFYLSYTIVKSATGVYYDMENFIITTDKIDGTWGKPIQVNSGCFDPSLFFDEDKLYLLAKIVDHRYEPDNNYIDNYSGIILQELKSDTLELIGDYKVITYGTGLGGEEGPQMFKRNGYYYLNIAEGGTEFGHQTTVLRSENLKGPFEIHPDNPVLKSKPGDELQKAGHSSFVVNDYDEWVISHLCARPIKSTAPNIKNKLCCPLGRETAIQKVKWKNDWPYIESGPSPKLNFSTDNGAESISINYLAIDKPGLDYLMLRKDMGKYNYLKHGCLIMPGYDSLMSKFDVNLYGHRVENLNFETTLTISYDPTNYLQMSGLALYYDTENYITVFITHDENIGKCIKVEIVNNRKYSTSQIRPIAIGGEDVTLGLIVKGDSIQVKYMASDNPIVLPIQYYSSYLSDDYILMSKPQFFTGMMSCFYSSDLSGVNLESKVKSFEITYL